MLFYVGDRHKTDLAYHSTGGRLRLDRLRTEEALTQGGVKLAEAAHRGHALRTSSSKARAVCAEEIEAVKALQGSLSPARRLHTLDPNGCWSLREAVHLCKDMHGVLTYCEDPAGRMPFSSGREIMAEFRRRPAGHVHQQNATDAVR
jgi:glucarate dehydratase